VLDAERVKALLSSRAKDPKSLAKKLERKQSKYEFAKLEADLGSVVTDLAGVRVIVYDDDEAEQVAKLIKDTWRECLDESIDRGYKARHFTVVVSDGESHGIDGARCEVQLT
jgi:ppGpp synthetase/RelA/SpoT-type nucleotidyltranferase